MAMLQVEKKLMKEPRESHDTQLYHKLQPVSKGGPTTVSVPGFSTARKTFVLAHPRMARIHEYAPCHS